MAVIAEKYRERVTTRELEILSSCASGYSSKEIAEKLFLSEGTVKFYRKNLIRKMGARNITECVAIGVRTRVIL